MKRRIPIFIIALLLLSTACVGWFAQSLNQELGRLKSSGLTDEERNSWKRRVAELEKRLAAMDNKATTLANTERIASDAEDSGPPGPGDFGGPGFPPGPGRGRRDNMFERLQALAGNPEYQKLMSTQQRAAVEGRYAALFKGLQLAPTDLEKFKNLLADKQNAAMDVLTAARAQGLTGRENQDQVRQMLQSAQGEVDQSIQQLLGAQGYDQYKTYEATAPQRATVDLLEKRLSYTQTPLTDQQSQQLVSILANAGNAGSTTGSPGQGIRGGFGLAGTSTTPIKDQAIQLAQGILAAPQLAALQQMQQEQKAAQQLARLLRGPAPGTAAAPTTTSPATPSKGSN